MSSEQREILWQVALASYDPRELRIWSRYLTERVPAICCTCCTSARALMERLQGGGIDVVVLGAALEDMDALEALRQMSR